MSRVIRFLSRLFCFFLVCVPASLALPKPHVPASGPPSWYVGPADDQAVELKIRPLYVDTRLREIYHRPAAHEVTDRLFVVRRVFRLDDALPEEGVAAPRWQ
jgi:hypothetical protein